MSLVSGYYVHMHTEYDLPERGKVYAAGYGYVDWRKVKRLKRKGLFKPGNSYKEAATEFLRRYRAKYGEKHD